MSITRVQLLSIPVTDQDRARDVSVEAVGLDMDTPVRNQAWGSSVVVRDPDGNRLVIQTTTTT